MSSRNNSYGKSTGFWARMNQKTRMYFVLALCCAVLMITSGICLFLMRGGSHQGTETPSADSEVLVVDSGYDKDQNTIDTTQYTSTILEESDDAGQEYVDETLFLGDSNTARMILLNYCTKDNAIGSVGMTARSLATFACAGFEGYSGYKTMAEAVALMQPRRVILTFGTNDLSPDYSTESFIENYKAGIQSIQEAYPSVDIIVNSIPPLGQEHSNQSLTQSQVDAYNQGIVQMCQDNGWKYLNSAEVLKDPSTGYAKDGYVISDGIHLTSTAMDAFFNYVRTHSYITEDDRPTLTAIPKRGEDKDASSSSTALSTPAPATETPVETPAPATETPVETPAPETSTSQESGSQESQEVTYTYWDETIAPSCTTEGYTLHHCNEDSSRDYTDSYTPALGHDPVTNADGSVTCNRCGAVLQAAAATPEPTPAPEVSTPTPPPSESTSSDSVVSQPTSEATSTDTTSSQPTSESTTTEPESSANGGEIQIGTN